MADDDNVVDFSTRAKAITERREQRLEELLEEDPIAAFFEDKDIMDLVMSGLMMIRQTSVDEEVDIHIDGDELTIKTKYTAEYKDSGMCDSETVLVKSASMMLVDTDGEELPSEILVEGLQACMKAIMEPMDDEDEPEESD
jgi:hypothetical protein